MKPDTRELGEMSAALRHVVRKSIFKEGFAIPRNFEEWISAPNKGCKREIYLIFDGYRIPAILRRIDNEQMSVQVKYENSSGQPFRYWLATVFNASLSSCIGEYFEVSRHSDTEFQITAFPSQTNSIQVLNVEQWMFHKGTFSLWHMEQVSGVGISALAASPSPCERRRGRKRR